MPANGTSCRAPPDQATAGSSVRSDWSESSARASRIMTIAVMSSTAKRMPATAAERRVRQWRAVRRDGAGLVVIAASMVATRARCRRPRRVRAGRSGRAAGQPVSAARKTDSRSSGRAAV